MRISLRSNNGAEEQLRFAQQIGAHGASIWARVCPGYEERGSIVPEHPIGLVGDSEWMHRSREWQVGYIRGLMQALGV